MFHANYYNSPGSIFPLVFFLFYFVFMELFNMKVDYRSSYFSDVWNILDFTFLILLGTYVFMYFRSEDHKGEKGLLAIVNLASWIRGLS